MRTSGPCLPSGRRSASTSSARVGAGQGEQPAQLVGHRLGVRRRRLRVGALDRVVHEHHVGVAAVGQLDAAEPAHRDDRHPGRRGVEPALLADGCGRRRRAPPRGWRRSAGTARRRRRPRRVSRAGRRPRSGTARGGGSRGPPRTASSASSWRPAAASISLVSASADSGARSPPSIRDALRLALEQVGGVAAWWPAAGPAARRPAPSSRSSPQVPGVAPSASLIRRKPSSPASGSGASANHSSITGSSVRWIGGGPGDAGGQRLEVPQRGLRVVVAERRQPRAAPPRA